MLIRGQRAKQVVLFSLLLVSGLSRAEASERDAVGGGFVDAGIEGAYFPNESFEGEPSFVRQDVRIDFDWSDGRPVGGSTAIPYRTFPSGGFSVRWKGHVLPRFSESYTFSGEAAGQIMIRTRKRGDATWTTLVDRGATATAYESAPASFESGEWYEIEVSYRAADAAARCSLRWSSKSTPLEVVDPVTQQGLTTGTWKNFLWADLVRGARWGKGAPDDVQGWPTGSDTELVAAEMRPYDSELNGTYFLSFDGQAKVDKSCCSPGRFEVAGEAFAPALPRGVGWKSTSNTTSALYHAEGSRFMFFFRDTRRSPGETDTGVTDIRMMRPIAQGSGEHHRVDEVVYRPFERTVVRLFTAFRWGVGGSSDISGRWEDRELPTDAFQARRRGGQGSLEHLIMLANETGKDLYISTPVAADDEYFRKFAQLLRFGSDGREPYTKPTSRPVYPPLNSNLRAYIEVGNEIWNWAFPSTSVAQRIGMAERDANSDLWGAIDFDGKAGDPRGIVAIRRWHALRTVACSDAFRKVYGDAYMGPRVRMLLEYQYNNAQNTAMLSLDFIDTYFGDPSSRYVHEPHPVNYYLWGAGGASYYGLANKQGTQDEIVLKDASFEEPVVPSGELRVRPKGIAWSFKGDAGVVRPGGAESVGDMPKVPQPEAGMQAAFLRGKSSIEQEVDFKHAGHFALTFQVAGDGPRWPGYAPFDIYVAGQRVSPRNQSDYRVAPGRTKLVVWGRSPKELGPHWGTAPFHIDKPGRYTVRFETVGKPDEYLLLDEVEVTSLDAMMESDFGRGQAKGQVSEANFERQLRGQATYARAFGLEAVAYEAGWSVGGDLAQTPLQNYAKFNDPRAREINDRAIEHWAQSGSFMQFWGVYAYWPSWDFENAGDRPIVKSLQDSVRSLPPEATFGASLPTTLRPKEAELHRTKEGIPRKGGGWLQRLRNWLVPSERAWFAWMVISPATASYELVVESKGSGSIQLELDGDAVLEIDADDAPAKPVRLKMTEGAHAFRLVTIGSVDLREIRITTAR